MIIIINQKIDQCKTILFFFKVAITRKCFLAMFYEIKDILKFCLNT